MNEVSELRPLVLPREAQEAAAPKSMHHFCASASGIWILVCVVVLDLCELKEAIAEIHQ